LFWLKAGSVEDILACAESNSQVHVLIGKALDSRPSTFRSRDELLFHRRHRLLNELIPRLLERGILLKRIH